MESQLIAQLGHLLGRAWRVVATGFCFVISGLVLFFLGLVVLPVLRGLGGGRAEGELRAQYATHLACRVGISLFVFLRVIRVEVQGRERLNSGRLMIANHPTLIDAILLLSLLPTADCVVKAGHTDNFWLRYTVAAAGYIPNVRGPLLVEECVKRLRAGRRLLIFPEGTRSPRGRLGPFARGAAHIAMGAELDPIPVTLRCDPATLSRDVAWWRVPERLPTFTVRVGEPIAIGEAADTGVSRAQASRSVTALLQDYFERQIDRGRK